MRWAWGSEARVGAGDGKWVGYGMEVREGQKVKVGDGLEVKFGRDWEGMGPKLVIRLSQDMGVRSKRVVGSEWDGLGLMWRQSWSLAW